MLILTRREGESIILSIPGSDQQIEVRVMETGSQVKLGIDAPREVVVLRKELSDDKGE
jgi:carbon storage regulator